MNKEQLEKLFDEIHHPWLNECYADEDAMNSVKDFIFWTFIKEVLKSVAPSDWNNYTYFSFNDIKQKAKEQFNIDL